MTQRQAVKAAKKRGLVSGEEAQVAVPTRRRRTCPADGETFLPFGPGHRGFCCACCATAWSPAMDRRIGRGVEVVLVEDGAVGVVESVADAERAVVAMEDGRRLTVGPAEVERIQYLAVRHGADCRKHAGARLAERFGRKAAPAEEGEDDGEK